MSKGPPRAWELMAKIARSESRKRSFYYAINHTTCIDINYDSRDLSLSESLDQRRACPLVHRVSVFVSHPTLPYLWTRGGRSVARAPGPE
jgi:hypothetical protein